MRTLSDLRTLVRDWRDSRRTIGFVPTMGALHAGHLSLVDASLAECDKTIVSIFVNPLQFDRSEDLAGYPRDLDRDLALLGDAGVAVVFTPDSTTLYPEGFATRVVQKGLTDHLCGRSRPGHFEGVLTVVLKLFNIVTPDVAYFGQKDYQQVAVIRRMVADFNLPIEIRSLPIVREADGLALSSRNALLNSRDRREAAGIHRALRWTEEEFARGESDADTLRAGLAERLAALAGARVDYAEIVDPQALVPRSGVVQPGDLVAAAVFFGDVRLIDNILLEPTP